MIISNFMSNTLLEVHSEIVQCAELVWGEPEVHRLHRSIRSACESSKSCECEYVCTVIIITTAHGQLLYIMTRVLIIGI